MVFASMVLMQKVTKRTQSLESYFLYMGAWKIAGTLLIVGKRMDYPIKGETID